ncbi:MAG: 3-isopropylmalate dehydratase small subunit, partial [Acidimicrobiales bacterium]
EWRDDRNFVLNDEQYAEGEILVAGPNFGTGSSREHAVWAIQQYGFNAVVSPRFADIFRNNCTKNGLVPVQVPADVGQQLLDAVEANPNLVITIDVTNLTLEAPEAGIACSFPLDAATQERFLEGLDDIGISLRSAEAIESFAAARPAWMPTTT